MQIIFAMDHALRQQYGEGKELFDICYSPYNNHVILIILLIYLRYSHTHGGFTIESSL